MKPIDITGWLQVASETTEKLRADICDGRIPDHPDGDGADADVTLMLISLASACERYRRDCLESPQQRRDDARADAYAKRARDA